jgi:hypothetical protein
MKALRHDALSGKFAEDAFLQAEHRFVPVVAFMIHSVKVKNAVNKKTLQFFVLVRAKIRRVFPQRIEGDHYVAGEIPSAGQGFPKGKGKHVGRLVPVSEPRIEGSDVPVAAEQHGKIPAVASYTVKDFSKKTFRGIFPRR